MKKIMGRKSTHQASPRTAQIVAVMNAQHWFGYLSLANSNWILKSENTCKSLVIFKMKGRCKIIDVPVKQLSYVDSCSLVLEISGADRLLQRQAQRSSFSGTVPGSYWLCRNDLLLVLL